MPTFAEGTIELDVPKEKVEQLLANPPEEIEFKGDIDSGEFKGHGVEGLYKSSSNGNGMLCFRITITKKPFYASIKMIEKELKRFLEDEDDE